MTREVMVRVNVHRRCPICNKPDWCLVRPDGTGAICKRVTSDRKCGNDAGYFHRIGEPRNKRMTTTTKPRQQDTTDWAKAAKRMADGIENADRRILDATLGLPSGTVERFMPMVGFNGEDVNGQCWTVPMVNGAEQVVGISRRYTSGAKKSLGNNGLFVPAGWRTTPGPVFVVEGASDTLAMAAAGLCAVGRFSNNGGVGMLIALLHDLDEGRPVIVVGERDLKDDGQFPGLACCIVAKELKQALRAKRAVKWSLPPSGHKDARDYLTAWNNGISWPTRGHALRQCLEADAVFAGDDTVTLTRMVVELRDAVARMQEQIAQLGGE